jgi:hypothetical protein
MQTLQEIIITEATEHEFKVELEEKHPKSWLKTVSAFANGQGGSFYIGVNDEGDVGDGATTAFVRVGNENVSIRQIQVLLYELRSEGKIALKGKGTGAAWYLEQDTN